MIRVHSTRNPSQFVGSEWFLFCILLENNTIDDMKQTFQAGVDAIYNAIVEQGVTPAGKTPADLASSIQNKTKSGVIFSYTASGLYYANSFAVDVKPHYANWQSITTGNIVIWLNFIFIHSVAAESGYNTPVYSYNPANGIITISNTGNTATFFHGNPTVKVAIVK